MDTPGIAAAPTPASGRLLTVTRAAAEKSGIPLDLFSPGHEPDCVDVMALRSLTGRDDVPKNLVCGCPKSFEQEQFTEQFIEACKAYANGRPIVYMSTPVTGGSRKYEFLKTLGKASKSELTEGEHERFVSTVIAANSENAFNIAECMREDHERGLVLDPGEISLPGWTQKMYLDLWLKVVNEVASEVVMAPGWELSKGCVYEVREALNRGIPVATAAGEALDRDTVQSRVSGAVERMEEAGFKELTMEEILKAPGYLDEWYLQSL